MARRLEGRVFHIAGNNGVTALVAEDILEGVNQRGRIYQELIKYPSLADACHSAIKAGLQHFPEGPYFAFVSPERYERSPWFTGDIYALNVLIEHIKNMGGTIDSSKGFWVPFSNGYELNLHGKEAQVAELKRLATPVQFRETFGIGINQIREIVAKKAEDARLRYGAGKD